MIGSAIGKRYARALFELAQQSGEIEAVGRALTAVGEAIEQSAELRSLIENPKYTPALKAQVIASLAERAGAPKTVKNALGLLTERRRIQFLPQIAETFRALAEKAAGRVRAEVITAAPLPESYFAELERTLTAATGRSVSIVRREDPSLIGGVITKVGDTVYDGSLRTRLFDIGQRMRQAASPDGR